MYDVILIGETMKCSYLQVVVVL